MTNNPTAEIVLAEYLRKAGLTGDSRMILGQQYLFECEHDSHEEILVGTIQAIGWSDEGGLQLSVTSPRFFGKPLISLVHSNGEWGAFIDVTPSKEFYPGKLHFIL